VTVGDLYFDFKDAQWCAFNIGGKAGRAYAYETGRITERQLCQQYADENNMRIAGQLMSGLWV
jgi:hypothetical protein